MFGIFILILIAISYICSGYKTIKKSNKEPDKEIRNQNIFSAVGLFVFGLLGFLILLYAIFL